MQTRLRRWWKAVREAGLRAWETERARGIGLLLFTACLGLGAIVYFSLPFEPGWLPILIALAGSAALTGFVPAGSRFLAAGLLAMAMGVTFGKIETVRHATPMIGSPIAAQVTGRVVTVEAMSGGRTRLTLDVIETARPALRYAPERIRASARTVPDDVSPGKMIRGVVRMMPPSGPVRPGSYDFAFESYFDGLGAIGFFLTEPEIVDTGTSATLAERGAAAIENLRMGIADRIRAVLSGAEGEIAAALIAGVRAGIPEEVNEDLRKTGLAHILSISGLHMALAAATIMGTIRLLFCWAATRRPVKKYAAAAALVGIAFYLLLSGSQVAAERSFLMLAVMLVAVMVDRKALNMRNLAIAGLIILAIAPHEIMGPSFQMSFAATAALVAGYSAWSARRRRQAPEMPQRRGTALRIAAWIGKAAVAVCVTSLLAGAATTIFGAYHFQRVSPLSLIANLAAMPLVSVLVMPFAVLSLVAMPFGLEALPLLIMGQGLDWMLAVAHFIAERTPVDAVGEVPISALVLSAFALAILTIFTTRLSLVALPLVALAMLTLSTRVLPDVLISEDARLVAIAGPGLQVNRGRPNAFTVEDWLRATGTEVVVKPGKTESAFDCTDQGCMALAGDSYRVAWIGEAQPAPACGSADLFVIDDATSKLRCDLPTIVLSKRELAWRGAASVTLGSCGTAECAKLRHALPRTLRPWHDSRRYSREARGLAPYRRENASGAVGGTATDKASSGG